MLSLSHEVTVQNILFSPGRRQHGKLHTDHQRNPRLRNTPEFFLQFIGQSKSYDYKLEGDGRRTLTSHPGEETRNITRDDSGDRRAVSEQQVYREQQEGERLRGGLGRRQRLSGREQTASQVGGDASLWCGVAATRRGAEVVWWQPGLTKGAESGCWRL